MLFWATSATNPENDSSEDSEVDNRLKRRRHFGDLLKDSKSVSGSSASRHFRVARSHVTSTQPDFQVQFQNDGLQSLILGFLGDKFLYAHT